jgi:predicted Zn-dependent protease
MAAPWRFFLIETDRAQGKDAQVQANLEILRKTLPAASPQRVTLADIYEALGRKDQALAVLRDLEKADPTLDYDQKVHIATLAGEAGQLDEALERWRTLWRQAALPARKIYLAKQVVRLARQGNRLDALAGEFEATLANGKVGQDELGLLIELRIAQNNRDDAVRDVERFAAGKGLDDTAKLKQLVAVYLRLKAYNDVEATLHRLVSADPKNADLYLRQLTLNAVRFPREGEKSEQRAARVNALLDALNKASGFDRPQALQFAAAIYAEAGFSQRATDSYRRAQAMQPGNLDTLGQLTDLMRKQGQQAQAAALLQYRALHAATPGDLVATINSLMTALTGGSADGRPMPGLAALRQADLAWARRLVIERLASEGEDARLYAVLADLGQAQGDFALQMRAYGTSLAMAGDQRPAVLRFLITLASGASAGGDGNAGPALGDVPAKLAYGRRLIALRREYPPEVYTDLARSLLAVGDMPGAESAFAMMGDISGLVNVDQLKGETYAGQGFAPQALLNYDRALLHDQGNDDLVVKTSILREQLGQDQTASLWYWRSLLALLRAQPDRRPDVQTDTAIDVQQYVPTLTEGLLLTWPADHAEAAARMETLRQMVDQSLTGVPAKAGQRLSDFPRLDLTVDLARRVAARTGDRAFMAGVGRALDTRFADDAAARAEADLLRDAMGWGDERAGAAWVADGLRRQAGDEANTELLQSLAFAGQDDAPLRAAMERAMAAYAAYDKAVADGQIRASGGEELLALMVKAADRLTPERFRSLILQPLDAAPFREDLFFDIYRSAGSTYARLVTLAGHPLLGEDRLIDLLVTRGGCPALHPRHLCQPA